MDDRDDRKGGEVEKSVAQKEIPSWYIEAYLTGRFARLGFVSMQRIRGLQAMAKDPGIS